MTDTVFRGGPAAARAAAPRPPAAPVPPGTTTPAYVYDLAVVRSAYARLRSWLPEPSELYYSLKANPHPAVVSTLHELGCRAEVSSPGELDAALQAGVPAHDILYTGPGKRDEDLDRALEAGVRGFAVDSVHGVGQLDRAAARHGVNVAYLLRVNPGGGSRGAGLRMTGDPSAFGADADRPPRAVHRRRARPYRRSSPLSGHQHRRRGGALQLLRRGDHRGARPA
ncbi:Orn/DAP/Arg decarboxylase 2, N-terminal [Actinobacteria bacterium OV320]|nr:Orn/DAP/Arg decarboxylase 2, N-terminal [Actinobacteria bacterium OV320]